MCAQASLPNGFANWDSPPFSWTTTLNNHAFSGAWVFIGFYFILTAMFGQPEKVYANLLLSGLSTGLAAASDSAAILFVGGFGLFILLSRKLRAPQFGTPLRLSQSCCLA
jgi:hypothetical protein